MKRSISDLEARFQPLAHARITLPSVNDMHADTVQWSGLLTCLSSQPKAVFRLQLAQLLFMSILILIKNTSLLPCTYGFTGLLDAHIQAT